jgi:hypothetical protein
MNTTPENGPAHSASDAMVWRPKTSSRMLARRTRRGTTLRAALRPPEVAYRRRSDRAAQYRRSGHRRLSRRSRC